MHPPRPSYGPFKLFSPRKGNYTTFNPKASLKGLYGGLSGTDCFLPATWTPAIAPARMREGNDTSNPGLPRTAFKMAADESYGNGPLEHSPWWNISEQRYNIMKSL